jgi:hypothetical protein
MIGGAVFRIGRLARLCSERQFGRTSAFAEYVTEAERKGS